MWLFEVTVKTPMWQFKEQNWKIICAIGSLTDMIFCKINLKKIESTIDSHLFWHPSKALPSSLSETFEVILKTLTFHDKEINKKPIYRHLFIHRKIFLNFILKKKYQVNINLTSFQRPCKVFPSRSKEF